jgi:hypothetical protein
VTLANPTEPKGGIWAATRYGTKATAKPVPKKLEN